MARREPETAVYAVVQTAEAFQYPPGKRWGPYVHLIDAEARVETIKRHKGDADIIRIAPAPPCRERRRR